jgi:murein DD-endopeptidase MepM/ murein hydrolase activator NlpD
MNYFRGYAGKRNQQIMLIQESEKIYFGEIEELEITLKENQNLLDDLSFEYEQLAEELNAKRDIVGDLNNKLDQLLAEQKQNRANAQELESRINEMLADESLKNQNIEKSSDALDTRTPEEILWSSGFTENQGKLPWPLEKGIISSNFGEHSHPEIQSIKIKNNGIDILTHQGANARSVFDGEVTRVMSVPNFNNVVIVRHGDFLTVYSNLSTVFVEPGAMVETKQEIGTIYTDQVHTKTKLHFEIWQGKHLLDPIEWITSYDDSDPQHQLNP